jgi:hypothetical protein
MCFRCIETRCCYVTGCAVVAALSFIVAAGVDGRLSLWWGDDRGMVGWDDGRHSD